jgi:hypothetical protein
VNKSGEKENIQGERERDITKEKRMGRDWTMPK